MQSLSDVVVVSGFGEFETQLLDFMTLSSTTGLVTVEFAVLQDRYLIS